jgi:hypothetical protein
MRFEQTIHRIMRAALAAQHHEHGSFRDPRKTFFVARLLVTIAQHALEYAELALHDPWLASSVEHGGKAALMQHAGRVREAISALEAFPHPPTQHAAPADTTRFAA